MSATKGSAAEVEETPFSGAGCRPSGAEESVAAFATDLAALLQTDPGQWVAYAHGNRVRIAPTQTELYRHCLKELGLRHDEFVVCCIVPDSGGKVEAPLRFEVDAAARQIWLDSP